jgi:sortase B
MPMILKFLIQKNIQTKKTMSNLLNYINSKATQYRDIGVTASDRLVALSTCESATTNGRIILFGRLS